MLTTVTWDQYHLTISLLENSSHLDFNAVIFRFEDGNVLQPLLRALPNGGTELRGHGGALQETSYTRNSAGNHYVIEDGADALFFLSVSEQAHT